MLRGDEMGCSTIMGLSKSCLSVFQGLLWAIAIPSWVVDEVYKVVKVGYTAAQNAMCSHVASRAAAAEVHMCMTTAYILAVEAMGGVPEGLLARILAACTVRGAHMVLAVYIMQQLQKFLASQIRVDSWGSWHHSTTCPCPRTRPSADDISNGVQRSSQSDLTCSNAEPSHVHHATAAATAADADECQPCTPLRLCAAGTRNLSPCSSTRSSTSNSEDASLELSGAAAAAAAADLMALLPQACAANRPAAQLLHLTALPVIMSGKVQTAQELLLLLAHMLVSCVCALLGCQVQLQRVQCAESSAALILQSMHHRLREAETAAQRAEASEAGAAAVLDHMNSQNKLLRQQLAEAAQQIQVDRKMIVCAASGMEMREVDEGMLSGLDISRRYTYA